MAVRRGRLVRVLVVLVVVVLVAGSVVGIVWWQQRQLIYFPDRSAVPPAESVIAGARDVTLHTDDGLELGAWFVPAEPAPGERDRRMAVLVAPGNGGNRTDRAGFAEELRRLGFAVLLLDYRGYGGNPGSPSEDGLAADAAAAVDALEELGFPAGRTIYFGESLGGGVVAALQAQRPPAGVVLRSPFTELADVGAEHYPWLPVRLLLRDRFPVLEHVRDSAVPLTVVYGDRDHIVPTRLSERVADEAPALFERVVVEGAGHNDPVMFGSVVARAVARLADEVAGYLPRVTDNEQRQQQGEVSEVSGMDPAEAETPIQPSDATAGAPDSESGRPDEGEAGPDASPEENRRDRQV